jgi:long-chain acyl-CoA synthetase
MANFIEHLLFRARLEPRAPAVQRLKGQASFAQLLRLVRMAAQILRSAGAKPGQRLLIDFDDADVDWLWTLAGWYEGLVTCSADVAKWPTQLPHDWVVTGKTAARVPDAPHVIRMQPGWQRQDLPLAPEPRDFARDDAIRLVLTSGTTGAPKAIALTHAQLQWRCAASLMTRGAERVASVVSPRTAGGLGAAIIGLMAGEPMFAATSAQEMLEVIRAHGVQGLHGAPFRVAEILALAERSGERLPLRIVRIAGGGTSPALLDRIHQVATTNVLTLYGSTEAGNTAAYRPDAATPHGMVGFPQIGAVFEVVDEAGQRVSTGMPGQVRVRTPAMASSYEGAPESSRNSFRDGWFYPGDLGQIDAQGRLQLAGRSDEVININGQKVDPGPIEEFLQSLPGVNDAACFRLESAAGVDVVGAALVAQAAIDLQAIGKAAQARFGSAVKPAAYFQLRQIPRNEMGRPQRRALSERFSGRDASRVRSA